MISCIIDAKENRDMSTVDISRAFMHAKMDNEVHMKLEGKMAELLAQLDPAKYEPYLKPEHGKQTIYVKLKMALYGTIKAALLFWKHLSARLSALGYKLNPYNLCVMNKDIDSSNCTILWHVDDLKISHIDQKVVTRVINMLKAEFGKDTPLTVKRGKIYEYLGMILDYSISGKIKLG